MDFNDTPEEAEFRSEVRRWLAANAPEHEVPLGHAMGEEEEIRRGRAWQQAKAASGYAGITLPPSVGGRGGSSIEQVIFAEEEASYRVVRITPIHVGLTFALPALLKHGTPEQLERFAGPTLRGELLWCQLFSEPGAGSDLAALGTRAVRDGDSYLVNGQKVWSSWAHHADFGILIARTDPTVAKHKGLTFFIVDMRSPGIEVRPIRQISGKSDFNETFLTDVRIPAEMRLGAEGEGWAVTMTVLMNERLGSAKEVEHYSVRRVIERAAAVRCGDMAMIDRPDVQEHLARWYVQEQGIKYFRWRLQTQLSKGQRPGAEAGVSKLLFTNRLQQTAAYAMEMLGYAGVVADPDDLNQAMFFDNYIWSSALRVAGGADEVLRNQIAERVLGMPSEIRADKDVPFENLSSVR